MQGGTSILVSILGFFFKYNVLSLLDITLTLRSFTMEYAAQATIINPKAMIFLRYLKTDTIVHIFSHHFTFRRLGAKGSYLTLVRVADRIL